MTFLVGWVFEAGHCHRVMDEQGPSYVSFATYILDGVDDHFADSYCIGIFAHKYLTADKISEALKNDGFGDDINGLGFLQRHLKE